MKTEISGDIELITDINTIDKGKIYSLFVDFIEGVKFKHDEFSEKHIEFIFKKGKKKATVSLIATNNTDMHILDRFLFKAFEKQQTWFILVEDDSLGV